MAFFLGIRQDRKHFFLISFLIFFSVCCTFYLNSTRTPLTKRNDKKTRAREPAYRSKREIDYIMSYRQNFIIV